MNKRQFQKFQATKRQVTVDRAIEDETDIPVGTECYAYTLKDGIHGEPVDYYIEIQPNGFYEFMSYTQDKDLEVVERALFKLLWES